jgi:isopentenyl diphosphate isomerase/L-lactate dehydrogenase-like FMN-dependent dehydrogenase
VELDELYTRGAEVMGARDFDFNLEGVGVGFTLRRNEEIFSRFMFRQKVINSIEVSTRTRLLDVELSVPVLMSSMTVPIPQIQDDGLVKVARALRDTGSMMCLGTPIPPNLKEVVATGVPVVQTVKPWEDRDRVARWIERAEEGGVSWVGIEVDAALGTRRAKGCAPMSVAELKEVKRRISRPFVLKGILSAWDADRALEAEADIIFVSNHGAHTIDYLPHPFDVIDEVHEVIQGRIPIIVDGGFRHGSDVLKGLAFGAQAIGLGRPILLALAADGEEGVKALITGLAEELRQYMTMMGVPDPASAGREILLKAW